MFQQRSVLLRLTHVPDDDEDDEDDDILMIYYKSSNKITKMSHLTQCDENQEKQENKDGKSTTM